MANQTASHNFDDLNNDHLADLIDDAISELAQRTHMDRRSFILFTLLAAGDGPLRLVTPVAVAGGNLNA